MAIDILTPRGTSSEIEELVRRTVDGYLAEKDAQKATKPKKIALIATKGTLDWAYPPLILAGTAASLGWTPASSSPSTG
jgi:hypothetical protein